MGKRFRKFAEDLVTLLEEEDTYLDAVETLEHELEVYYDEVVNESVKKPTTQLYESKASHPLNDPEPIDSSTITFSSIKV